ncbi:O-antigen ligase family protein [Rapidithrix thailandica]|uniref:O-antigen ligase family protein n=1 Tax=Rapidithrix thailandica TaxID=413964 RepID=A0AAW9SLF8_9BACT
MLINSNSLIEDVNYILLVLIAVFMPIGITASSIIIILLVLLWILSKKFSQTFVSLKNRKLLIPLIVFYLLHVIALLYTKNIDSGLFALEVRLSMLIFPIVIGGITITTSRIRKILLTFSYCIFFYSLLCYFVAVYKSNGMLFETSPAWRSPFNRENYTSPILGIHPSYFSMYVIFAILILFEDVITNIKAAKSKIKIASNLIIIPILIFTLFNLSSRTSLVIFVLFFLTFIYRTLNLFSNRKYKIISWGVFIFIGFAIYALFFNEKLLYRYSDKNSYWRKELQWVSAIDVFKKSPIVGVSPGDALDELMTSYEKYNYQEGVDTEFNVHNQHLQTLNSLGLIGLILFELTLILPFLKSVKQKNYLIASFFILFGLSVMTESMLRTQKGVIFYSFFSSLLLLYLYRVEEELTNKSIATHS